MSERFTAPPVPADALDDRLGFIGNTGSGKTYGAGVCVEQLLADRRRVVIADPLGVWWGLRLTPEGGASRYNPVIFGGPRADIAITEHSGAIIGETIAGMKESAILDLSLLGTKAAEQRFMLAFLTSLYRKTKGEPLHLVFDEADMWAPQSGLDGGAAPSLLGQMETICRRGRVKGFIPWLITQRPAVLSKNVLSQVDGLIAFKLTSSQDRAALGAWIDGQADRAEAKEILGKLPTLERGRAIVWLPARDILRPTTFPAKVTFDSSATPKRGEKRREVLLLKLDVDALRARLADVENTAKSDDPATLKKRIAELERGKAAPGPDAAAIEAARREGHIAGVRDAIDAFSKRGAEIAERIRSVVLWMESMPMPIADESRKMTVIDRSTPLSRFAPSPVVEKIDKPAAAASDAVPGPHRKVFQSLRFWSTVGYEQPSRVQVAAVAGYSAGSGNFNNILGAMKAAGRIDYPAPGAVCILNDDDSSPAIGITAEAAAERFFGVVKGPGWKVLNALVAAGEDMSREVLAVRTDYSAGSGNFNNILGRLRALDAIDYPTKGMVRVSEWVGKVLSA